jgi:serine/threonine-protein kinase RsbW
VAEATPSERLQFQLVVSSRFENIEIVQVVLNDALERLGLDDENRHWIELAVREAVANAIKHGNRGEPDKHVEVELAWDDGVIVVRVEDEGAGFDPHQIDDPRAPENLLRPNGRGIFYIESFMDQVAWETGARGGTVVTLRKRVHVPAAEDPAAPGAGEGPTAQPV